MIIRFQNATMDISAGVSPSQALESLMATTYMKCRIPSMVRSEHINRTLYSTMDAGGGLRCLWSYVINHVRTAQGQEKCGTVPDGDNR